MYNMLPNHKVKTFQMPDGTEISLETGKLAKQAQGSVVLKVGKTMLLATMCYAKEAKEGVDFLPLTVDYQEKYASLGRFPGGFFKREARPSEYEILISRLIDRAIRPLFPSDWHADVQLQVTLISGEKDVMPDAYAALAASAALIVSDIPFTGGPISEVRVAQVDGILKVNPAISEIARATLDLMIAGSAKDIVMVEGEGNEVSEELMLEALALGHEAIKSQCKAQKELEEMVGSTVKVAYSHEKNDWELKDKLYKLLYEKAYAHAKTCNANKSERGEGFKAIIKSYIESLPEDSTEDKGLIKKYYHDIEKDAARNLVLDDRIRLDGRKLDEVRPIWSEISYLPSAHGSALFTRGETQSLTTVTLGTKLDEQTIDGAVISGSSKFNLHYNFPAFSTGEVKPNRGLGRREVGHGNLAQRSLKKVAPPEGEFPYTVRVVSDILESNGSSSMATVCAGSLALMDAGVPMRGGVSGIAMGLITDSKTGKYAVLSDILGDEDHLGDMDFKVAGTSKGITACQMDIKVDGLSYEVLKEALYQAKKGRAHILAEMNKTISQPNVELNANAPRIYTIKIDKDQIGAVIGPGGKVVQEIQKTTGATITIEEIDNKGVVNIFAVNKDALDAAVRRVKGIVAVPEIGEVYEGVVKSIQAYGAFVEFMPGKDGLLHISEIKWDRVENMEGVLEVGETLKVKLMDVDPKTGKFRLSRKALLPKPETSVA